MKTHPLQFTRPLRNARVIPTGSSKMPSSAVSNADPDANKLTATSMTESGNVPAPAHEVRDLLAKIEQHVREMGAANESLVTDFQELAIKLATQIASSVVRYEVTTDVTRIRKLIESVRSQVGETKVITVQVNKIDLEQLQQCAPDLSATSRLLQLKSDDSIAVGDCQIESEEVNVVANYARQIDEIQQQLMESLPDARLERKHSDTNHQHG